MIPTIDITEPDDLFPVLLLHGKIKLDDETTACVFGQLHDWRVVSESHHSQSLVVLGDYENDEYKKVRLLIKLGLQEPEPQWKRSGKAILIPPLEYERRIYEKFINVLIFQKCTPNLRAFVGTVVCDVNSLLSAIPKEKKNFHSKMAELKEKYIKEYNKKPAHIVALVIEGFEKFTMLKDVVGFLKVFNTDYPTTAKKFIEMADKREKDLKAISSIMSPSGVEENRGFIYSVKHIPSFLFQILYTLNCLKKIGLKHNDLHLGNVAIEANTKGTPFDTNSIIYVTTTKVRYAINVKNAFVKLYDWDEAYSEIIGNNEMLNDDSHSGEYDEYRCREYGRCNEMLNRNYDVMHVLAQIIIESNFTLMNSISAILDWTYDKTKKWVSKWGSMGKPTEKEYRPGDLDLEDLITQEEIKAFDPDILLASPFFDMFKLKDDDLTKMIQRDMIRRDMVFFLPGINQKERNLTLNKFKSSSISTLRSSESINHKIEQLERVSGLVDWKLKNLYNAMN